MVVAVLWSLRLERDRALKTLACLEHIGAQLDCALVILWVMTTKKSLQEFLFLIFRRECAMVNQ